MPSQKGTEINKEINTSLLATSQKVSNIKKGYQPGTQNKGMDTSQTLSPRPKMFERRKKTKTSQGAHTVVQSFSTGVTEPLLNSALDASPTNVEKQPHSFNIPFPTSQATTSPVAMIDNLAFLNSPSLQLREEPTLQTHTSPSRETSFLDLLTTNSPNIEKITKSFTSTDNIQSTDIISSTYISSSTDIPHPLTIPNSSTDIQQSMDSPTELINQVLLGMREMSDFVSEGQARDLEKGEDESERTPTSSGGEK